jgi:hypothetical protein
MPVNINEKYKTDAEFRERMKANSRKRYQEMKAALEEKKKAEKQKDNIVSK